MNNNRIVSLDVSRAICMLWIVGVWHLQEYLIQDYGIPFHNKYTECITVGTLAMFTFMSGYLMSREFKSCYEIIMFYKNRILRFYPLFFLSCVLLYVISAYKGAHFFSSLKQLFLTLFGLSCYITPSPATVWYLSMLMSFYCLTPLINWRDNIWHKIIKCFIVYMCLWVGVLLCGFDRRVVLYFPVYCIGLSTKNIISLNEKIIWKNCLFSILTTYFATWLCVNYDNLYIFQIVMEMTAIVTLYYVGKIISKISCISVVLEKISYASMCAYLFHRHFYWTIKRIVGPFNFALAFLIILPMIIIICYYMQKQYDLFLRKCLKTWHSNRRPKS